MLLYALSPEMTVTCCCELLVQPAGLARQDECFVLLMTLQTDLTCICSEHMFICLFMTG